MPFWLRLPIFVLAGCCLVALAVAAFVRFHQHSLIYHPRPYGPAYARLLPSNGVELEYVLPFGKQTAFYIPPSNGYRNASGSPSVVMARSPLIGRGFFPVIRRTAMDFCWSTIRATERIPATPL